MKKQNILYFTSYPLDSNDGGVMAIMNDLSQIVQIHNINLYVIIICKEEQKEKAAIQLDKLEINYSFISLKVTLKKPEKTSKKIFYKIRNLVSFWQEMDARFYLQDQVADISKYLTNFCETLFIEIIIFEQLYSVLWFKNFLNLKQKKIYLAFDKEAELFRYLTKYKNAKFLLNDKKVLINSQIFPPKLIPWHYTNSGIVFFAGSINYYPNFLAVKWLISELSPKLLRLNNKIKIVITGTNYDDMPKDWTIENNVYIPGFIPQEQLENLFQTSDMFICPIDNDFSVKMKLVECVSYGLPFFATQPCLNALPYLSGLPILDTDKPDEAAAYICDTLSKKEVLEKLNKQILEDAINFNKTRKDWWKKAIFDT